MDSGNIRNYQVNYEINAEGTAATFFTSLAENAEKLQEPLQKLQEQIKHTNSYMNTLKDMLELTPTFDSTQLKDGLTRAEELVKASALRMAKSLEKVMGSGATLPTSQIKENVKRTVADVKEDMQEAERQFAKLTGGKDLAAKTKSGQRVVRSAKNFSAEAQAVFDQYRQYEKELNQLQSAPVKMSKTASAIVNSVKKSDEIKATATQIRNLNEAVNEFNNRKTIKVKVDADTSKAIDKLNAFLKMAQEPVIVPLKAKAPKPSKNEKGKTTAPVVSETVKSVQKTQEKATQAKAMLNGNEVIAQYTKQIEELQKIANSKPVVLKAIVSLDKAGYQLNQAISSLQKLADSKPVIIRATTSAPTTPNTGVATNVAQTATVNDGKGTTQVSATSATSSSNKGTQPTASKWAATQSQINAYERHRASMADMRINNAVDVIKQRNKLAATNHVSNQTMYDQLFGRETMHQRWFERDAAGESTRARRNAARQAISDRAALNAAQYNARELARLREITAQQTFATPNEPTSRVMSTPTGRGGYSARFTQPKNDLYTRSRAFWYPFTGNTSFGARTPMAVDMAKGMGTMFAIGGAMSAVGSSLNQAVEYQNIMKTTNAILKNGTDNYSNGAFKGMEQIVRQVGKDTKFTAPQVASAAKFLAMAGYDIPAINSAIKPVSNIALIGDTDLGATADKLTNVMTTFGIAPEKMNDIADIMTTTFTRSNTDMMMLAESAKYAGGIANLYGGNFQNNFADVMAMFGVLGNAGIQASSAGTTLRMMYQNLMQPNKNQRAALKQYGIYTRDTSGNPLEMVDILKQIAAKVPKDKLADAIGSMFRITAQPGAAALATHLNGSNGLIALMEANRTAAGTGIAENIANEKKNTISGLWAQVQSTFTEGVLQAFEGKEGGWAGMLIQLRDYLAQPETVETLRSIVDLVENLAKIIGDFAKVYAKVYSMFPGVINSWIKFQLAATQFGYLVTPIIQLIGVLNVLKTAVFGTSAAAATATIAENTFKRARNGGAVASAISGFAPRYANYTQSGKAAANYAAYQSGMAYWLGKRTNMKNIANLHGGKAIAAMNPQLASDIKSNPSSLGLQMYAQKYKGSIVAKEYGAATRAAQYAQFAEGRINATKSQYFENLRAVRRPGQMMNRSLIDRYAAMGGDAALIASARAQIAARDARIAPIAAARHASRGMVASDVRERFARMNGWKKAAGMSWKTSFSAGQALGTISMASMVGSLKNMALSLFSGLARAIGMLTSPVGLVTLAIGTAVTATLVQINRIKKAQAQSEKQAKSDAQTMVENQKAAYKPIEDINKKYRAIGDTLRPAEDTQAVESAKQSKKWYDTYIGAFNANSDAKEAEKAWYKSILGNENTRLAFGNRQLRYIDSWKDTGKRTFEGSINYGGDNVSAEQLYYQQRDARNYNSADSRAREALFLAGASNNTTVKAQQEIIKLRQQLLAGKITSDAYTKQANEIRASVANPKMPGLLNAMDYSASELKNAPDITRFSQYQQGAWNLLTAELNADIGTLSGYLNGVEQLKKGVKAYSDQWWYAVARVYDGMKYPLEIAGKTTDIVLNALPNGRIDTSRIITQIQQIAENLQLNIFDFAKMASSIYEAMAKIGVVPGKYYSDFMKFTYSQTQHADVTAADAGAYFDRYIAKGDKNATWGGLNRQQYIDYIQSSSGNKGKAAKERVLIRKTLSNNAAINSKRQYDKTVKSINDLTGNNKDKGSTSGSNAGTDKNKGNNQKEYANTYDRSAARPTQVIINIDNLARFDRTAIAGNSDERAIAEAIETKIAEAVAMISSQALDSASSLISQGLA